MAQTYSSQGPEIHHIEWYKDEVHVQCSAAQNVVVMGAGTRTSNKFGQSITDVTLPTNVLDYSDWLRVTVTDAAGKSAWSNPIRRSDI